MPSPSRLDPWTTASAGDGSLAQGTLAPAEAPFSRHPKTTDGLTHGWRWYRVVDGRLLSPLAPGRIELPRNGSLDYGHFIPRAEDMFWMAFMIRREKWYDFALTFGEVHGPFGYDHAMPLVGSMQSTRYQALIILSDRPEDIKPNYDILVIDGHHFCRPALDAVERAYRYGETAN